MNIMFLIILIIVILWVGYEIWRAPVLRADDDSEKTFTIVRRERTFKDLFKKSKHGKK